MTNHSRRRFLVQLGAAAGVGATTPLLVNVVQRGGLPFAWALGESDVLPSGTPICVHIALDGGNDHLNTLVPFNDGWYRDATVGHGAIALSEAETLALNGSPYRLHSQLPWLADRWNTLGDVGFALGVGNLAANFSHFDSMRYWSTAHLTKTPTGWLGRYADAVRPQNALASVSLSDLRLDAVARTASALVVQDCAGYGYATTKASASTYLNSAKQMGTITGTNQIAAISKMITTTLGVVDRVKAADDAAVTGSTTDYTNLASITKQLTQAALLIKSGIPAQTYTMSFGPFDSHVGQKAMQASRFSELNEGLTKFFGLLAGHARQNDVFVLITSEFGRQVTANRDLGTDHGQAGMAVFIGGGVRGGVYGLAPTLDPGGATRPNRIADALRPTVDFRSVHATALNRLAKGDGNVGDSVLGAHYEDLGVFKAPVATTTTSTTSTTVVATTTTTAPNKVPIPAFTLTETTGYVGFTTTGDASASRDPDGTIVRYRWTWGDSTASSTGVKPSHQYTKRGTFTVRLTVTDDRGATASTTRTVRVY